MNSLKLINRVKYSKTFYNLYYYVGSLLIRVLKFIVRPDDKLIVFASFGGRKFDDSPKAVYEAILLDQRFDEYNLVWAFMQPDNYVLPRGKKVKIDTFAYYKLLLKARVWVTNSSMTRGLNFTGKQTFELNTWHGSAIKKMGSDIDKENTSFRIKNLQYNDGVMLAQGQYDVDVFSRAFHRPEDYFRIIGLPRNDELAHVTKDIQAGLKEKLGIPQEKIVILYAPTFREYEKDGGNNCVMAPPMDLKLWKEMLGKDYVLLMRAHYEVARVMDVEEDDFVKNVSAYPNLNELMMASDMLISDYSSIYFDYAIQGKPMLCFAYDYERYAKERGMYFDVREYLPNAETEGELLSLVRATDCSQICESTRRFRETYVTEYGSASRQAVEIIHDALQ